MPILPLPSRARRPRLHARARRTVLHTALADSARAVIRSSGARRDDMRKGHLQARAGRTIRARTSSASTSAGESRARSRAPRVSRLLLDLARVADVAVENFRAGVARGSLRLRDLVSRLPDLVYCSISGSARRAVARAPRLRPHRPGRLGSHAPRAGGAAHAAGREPAGGRRARGHACPSAILAALWRRARTGAGARLDSHAEAPDRGRRRVLRSRAQRR